MAKLGAARSATSDSRPCPRGSRRGATQRARYAGEAMTRASVPACAASLVALLAAVGCASAERPPADRPPRPAPAPARSLDAACVRRCEVFQDTRHDACGPGARRPWPQWCAESRARGRFECELTCLHAPKAE